MPEFARLLRCVGRAVVGGGFRALSRLVPFGEVAFEVAREAYSNYRKSHDEADLRADLERLAAAPPEEVRQVAEQVAAEAADARPELVPELVVYLTEMPAAARRSLRRPSDPLGLTVPVDRPVAGPENLLAFLPAGLPRFRPGDRPLAADWELVELLGTGGFGEVWKARHLSMPNRRPVALKFCLDARAAESLRHEAALHDVLERVRGQGPAPGVVPLLETYLRAEVPCLMYEYVEGGDLSALARERLRQARPDPDFAVGVVKQLASALAGPHRQTPPLVHRDLKPSNVLVRPGAGGGFQLMVADFGIGGLAHVAPNNPATLTAVVRGAYTPLYASPQQTDGGPPDPRDDVHALGVIWYQLAAGEPALRSIPPDWQDVARERGVGGAAVELLAACLASRADKRPADAGVLLDRLNRLPKHGPAPRPAGSLRGAKSGYTLRHRLAAGDAADVHLAADDAGAEFVVKITRPPANNAMLDAEREALGRLHAATADAKLREPLPVLVESFLADGGRRVNVFQHRPGLRTLDEVRSAGPVRDAARLAAVFARLLGVLGLSHRAGVVHGAVLPCHVLMGDAGEVLLVGWGQSVAAGRPVRAVPTRYRSWYPPEVLAKKAATAATDVYLAAKCVAHLAGGATDAVPEPLRRFVRACLLEGAAMRPHDAGELAGEVRAACGRGSSL